MESLTLALNNNNTEILAEQENIHNSVTTFNSISLEILDDDSITNILLYFDDIADFKNCKCLNKRICRIIKADAKLQKHAFFLKYCIDPKSFLELPIDYLLSINNQLKQQSKTTTINNENLYINKNDINLKKKLFFAIEKNLAQAKTLSLKSITTISNNNSVNCIAFSKDNKFFATASSDNIAKIFQFIKGDWQQLDKLNQGEPVQKIIFSPDSNYIITLSTNKYIIWNLSTKGCKEITSSYSICVAEIYFRNDSKRLLLKVGPNHIQVLDLNNNQSNHVLTVHDTVLGSLFNFTLGSFKSCLPKKITEDTWLSFIVKRNILSSIINGLNSEDKDLANKLRNMVHGTKWRELLKVNRPWVKAITYSNDMQLIYVCPIHAPSVILKYTDNQWQLKLKFLDSNDANPCFSPDNQRIMAKCPCSGIRDKTRVWNINGNEANIELVLDDSNLAQFSQDGMYIIAANQMNQITIWQFIDHKWTIKTTIDYEHTITNILFSNYNWMIAVSSINNYNLMMEENNSTTKILEVMNDDKKE